MIALLLLGALSAAPRNAPPPDPYMGAGISRTLATHRARQLADVRYDLRLDVTSLDRATGHVTVRFARRAGGDVIMDFRGLALEHPRVNGRPLSPLAWNHAHVRIPEGALASGENVLDVDFAAAIAPAGASIIHVHDLTDGADYLYTLLVPADANALFPCFDQPDLKARVTVTLKTKRGWTAVANGALVSADSTSDATIFHFARTEPISTYLIAFAAGPWVTVAAPAGARPMRLFVRASRATEVEADTLLALHARALEWLERYFDRPYPFGKFDFVLAPAFPFGGMEHPGAVFYNEENFIFRERPTLPQQLAREGTIFHEVAHQWFGDLVTMRWFDDLWLKEGFASYMAAVMQSVLDPASDAWKTFYLRNRAAAYEVDASAGTTPVWQSLSNLDHAKSNYGAIVYDKAPAILKQLNYLVGDTAFRDGLRAYLRAHAFANAAWRDLLSAVGTAAHRDLDAWGRAYILRPGMPVLEQRLTMRGDTLERLELVQHPARPLSGPRPWPARLEVLVRRAGGPPLRVPVELTGTRTVVPLPEVVAPELVYANAGDEGYALVMLDARSAAWLEAHIGTVEEPLLRAMLWGSMWDLVRAARLSPARYLALAMRELPAERDEQIAAAVLARVTRATTAYLSDEERASIVPRLEAVLDAGARDEARPYGIRKAHLDALIAIASTPPMLAQLDSLLDRDSAAGAPLRAPTRWSIVTALVANAVRDADARAAAELARDSTTEGRRRAFVAGAARPTAENKRAYFTRWFHDPALNEDWVTASLRAFNTPTQSALTLPYLVPALDTLGWIQRNRRIFFLGSWLAAFMDGQTSPAAVERVHRFLAVHPRLPADLRQKILQTSDELERTTRIRDGARAPVSADLPH